VKLRDVLFLCHAKPKDAEPAAVWKTFVENTLEPPDAREVAWSAGKGKRENFERLLREGKLGGLPYQHGISSGSGWTHLDGWPGRIVDYIAAVEAEAAA
jgi:hypothetical protein